MSEEIKYQKIKYQEYIDFVLDPKNKDKTCDWVKLAVKRHAKDLKRKKFKYYFSEEKADRAIKFFSFLKHFEGKFRGKTFVLEPWQQFIVAVIFGWLRKDNDKRRFKIIYLEVARKNGKSTLLSGVGLFLLTSDGEYGAQIYTVATKYKQACIIHDSSTKMTKESPALNKRILIFKNNLSVDATYSKYEPLGADSNTEDGLNVHGFLIDEYHAHKTNEMYSVGRSAMGAREQPIILIITTAGFDKQRPCYVEQHEYTRDILMGRIKDENYFGIIYSLDKEDDWVNEKVWIKANPNLGVSVSVEDMRIQCNKALNSPTEQNEFLTKKLNIWTQAVSRWIEDKTYAKCSQEFNYALLKGKICYGGLDASSAQDITAWILCFPPQDGIEKFILKCYFFLPAENIGEKSRKDKAPYDQWAEDGYITLTPGKTVDYTFLEKQILEDAKNYKLKQFAYDRYNLNDLITRVIDHGIDAVEFSQSTSSISAPAKDFEKKIIDNNIIDGGNPVMSWMISCTEIKVDASGQIKPIKPDRTKSGKRIDGVIASIMAVDRAVVGDEATIIHEEIGISFF